MYTSAMGTLRFVEESRMKQILLFIVYCLSSRRPARVSQSRDRGISRYMKLGSSPSTLVVPTQYKAILRLSLHTNYVKCGKIYPIIQRPSSMLVPVELIYFRLSRSALARVWQFFAQPTKVRRRFCISYSQQHLLWNSRFSCDC